MTTTTTHPTTETFNAQSAVRYARAHHQTAFINCDGSVTIVIPWIDREGNTGEHRHVCRSATDVRDALGY